MFWKFWTRPRPPPPPALGVPMLYDADADSKPEASTTARVDFAAVKARAEDVRKAKQDAQKRELANARAPHIEEFKSKTDDVVRAHVEGVAAEAGYKVELYASSFEMKEDVFKELVRDSVIGEWFKSRVAPLNVTFVQSYTQHQFSPSIFPPKTEKARIIITF